MDVLPRFYEMHLRHYTPFNKKKWKKHLKLNRNFQKLLQAWKYVAKDYFGLRISFIPNDIPESFCGPDDSYIQIARFTIKQEKSVPSKSDPSDLLPIDRKEVIVVGLECKNTKPSLTAQIACLKFENIPLHLNEQNDIQARVVK